MAGKLATTKPSKKVASWMITRSCIHQIKHNKLKITKKGNANLDQPTLLKKCKNGCVQGIFKTTKEAFSSQLYSTYDFQQKHCKI